MAGCLDGKLSRPSACLADRDARLLEPLDRHRLLLVVHADHAAVAHERVAEQHLRGWPFVYFRDSDIFLPGPQSTASGELNLRFFVCLGING